MDAILEGSRRGFGRRGPKERLSRELILQAQEGSHAWVQGVLRDDLASPNVADARGYSALAAAAVSPSLGWRVGASGAGAPRAWGPCPPPRVRPPSCRPRSGA